MAYCLSILAPKIGLLAYPGDHRLHLEPTPMVGGIAIFIGIALGVFLLDQSYLSILPSLFLLCFIGGIDDRYKLPFLVRFAAQAFSAYLMIELTGTNLTSLGNLFLDTEILLGEWSKPLTIFAVVGVINAINMSDGLDGLAGSLTVLVLITALILNPELHSFTAINIAAIAGFLFWNLRVGRLKAKLFMGDAGSTMLGLVVAFNLIQLSQAPVSLIPPVTVLWFLAIPLFDAVSVLLIRPLKGRSPFAADRIHYHHIIQDRGLSVNATLVFVLLLQTILILFGLYMNKAGITEGAQLSVFLFFFSGYMLLVLKETRKQVFKK